MTPRPQDPHLAAGKIPALSIFGTRNFFDQLWGGRGSRGEDKAAKGFWGKGYDPVWVQGGGFFHVQWRGPSLGLHSTLQTILMTILQVVGAWGSEGHGFPCFLFLCVTIWFTNGWVCLGWDRPHPISPRVHLK